MSALRELSQLLTQTKVITNFVVLPIAGSALLITLNHYRRWEMWQLYLVLLIIVWTTVNSIVYLLL